MAFEKYGMDDIEGSRIKEFARERGLAALSCYETLKNLIRYDWVQFTTNEKFMSNNNAKLWYSIIMYNFLKESSRDLNWSVHQVYPNYYRLHSAKSVPSEDYNHLPIDYFFHLHFYPFRLLLKFLCSVSILSFVIFKI